MNILHLSDIHFGRNDPAYGLRDPFAKHDQILDELIETVGALDSDLRPEHIVFTGDIAWHGKRTEFAEAYEWFSRLLDALGLEGRDISFCVGNHDVDRGYRCISEELNDYSLDEISKLYRYENVHLLEPSIYAYDEFCRKLGMVPYAYPVDGKREYSYSVGYKDIPFACGRTVRIVSLNTALLTSQPGISEDKMWLGQEQLRSLIEYGVLPSDRNEVWYTIMLYHHSDRFLHPNETSTYDGRCATLPMMMSYADLLLCGHTESSGRPRLTKQLGGGMLLSAGAAYYSDTHHNAFSMLYLSDERRTAGFLPYAYDNGWKDYDFEQPEIDAKKLFVMPQSGKMLRGAKLKLSADGAGYEIPLADLEITEDADGGLTVDNRVDFMSNFSVLAKKKADGETALSVSAAEKLRNYVRTRFAWKDYADFMKAAGAAETVRWQITGKGGEVLLDGIGVSAAQELPFEEALMHKLRCIEFYFDVRFTLPDTLGENDLRTIEVLCELAEQGYTEKISAERSIGEHAGREELLTLSERLLRSQRLLLHCKESCAVTLFGVQVDFGKVDVFAGPYHIDAQAVHRKLDTFCEGDLRTLSFEALDGAATCLVCDMASFVAEKKLPADAEVTEVSTIPLILE